jgi:myo-inositol 2-dehydrogenase/D-chiro-inositol 1-dehydrogenase
MPHTTRRDFVRSSAAAVAVAATGQSIARSAHAAGQERFRVALIGAGGRGTGATADCLNVAKHIKLVAVADAFADRAGISLKLLGQYFPEQLDVPPDRVFTGFEAYRQALACECELAILAAPPAFRPTHYQAAVDAGKHLFMEKPLCVDAPGYRSVMETNKAAEQKGLKIGVGLYRRHHPSYVEAIERIHAGAVGKISFMRCTCNMTRWGNAPRKPGQSEMEYQVRGWRCFEWLSGGRLVEAHCHELDVMDWAIGDHPVEANGMGGRQATPRGECAYDYDHHFHEYTYANGVKMYSQSRSMNGVWQDITEHIHGTRGTVDLSGKILKINEYGRREQANPYRLEHQHLLEAIWNNKPYHEGWIGASSSFTAILGREASYSGQIVRWDELAAKGRSLLRGTLAWNADPPVLPDEKGSYDHAVPVPGVYRPF